ncbi:298_t:CDS:1, partial [Dentiscutata heterogama]
FSIVLWEIGTRKIPFNEIKDDIEVTISVIEKNYRPTPDPPDAPLEYIKIIKQGWSIDKLDRPTIMEIREKLHNLSKEYQKNCSLAPIPHNSDSTPIFNETLNAKLIKPEKQEQSSLPPIEDIIKLHENKKYAEAFPLFQRYSELSHVDNALAKFYYGYYLHGGSKYGVSKDDDMAIHYLREAADAGVLKAQFYCAEVYLKSTSDSDIHNKESGIKYLKMAVDRDDRQALEMWAEILYYGMYDQDSNPKEAINAWKRAEKNGSKIAKKWLSKIEKNTE